MSNNFSPFRVNHHFIPEMLLRHFVDDSGKVYVYRLLVPDQREPLWTARSIRSTAAMQHLHTLIKKDGSMSDSFEKWIDIHFESPAAEPLRRAISGGQLSAEQWELIFRFAFLQHVRTIRRFIERRQKWDAELLPIMESTLSRLGEALEDKELTAKPEISPQQQMVDFPMHLVRMPDEGDKVPLRLEVTAGRQLWLYEIEYAMRSSIAKLPRLRWTILRAPLGFEWVLTDDPLVRMRHDLAGRAHYDAGWAQTGAEIFMPISPNSLLYCCVGHKPPQRNTELTWEQAAFFQHHLLQRAYRTVISRSPVSDVSRVRKRKVDSDQFAAEEIEYVKFHQEQSEAMRPNLNGDERIFSPEEFRNTVLPHD